ncbi:MAG TPA: hypothetical protein VF192_08270 [Longimicrobiales bacterium]
MARMVMAGLIAAALFAPADTAALRQRAVSEAARRITGTTEASAGMAARQQQRALVVGLLRVDCVALPFAIYDAGRWERLPFDSAPPLVRQFRGPWHFTSRTGQVARLSPGDVVTYASGSGDSFYEGWGIRTDHRPCSSLEGYYPVERIGVVLSEPLDATAFQPIAAGTDLHRIVSSAVAPEFERQEEAMLRKAHAEGGWQARLGHPTSAAVRRQEPIHLTELYGATIGDTTYVYFIARREYPPPPGVMQRSALSVLHGWGIAHAGSLSLQSVELFLDTESRMQTHPYTPFALLPFEGALYVVAEMRQYEGSVKQVLRWGDAGPEPVLPEH